MNGVKRAVLMHKLADLIEANGDEITKAEVTAMGQPAAIMAGFIVPAAAASWRYYAGEYMRDTRRETSLT
jgi:aldehyde dehydrogenase (NAD+)